MRSNPLALAVSALTLIAVASCGDDDTTPGNDAGTAMDSGVADAGATLVDTGTARDHVRRPRSPVRRDAVLPGAHLRDAWSGNVLPRSCVNWRRASRPR